MAEINAFQKKLIEALQAKKVSALCPCCGQNNWTIVDKVVSLPVAEAESVYRIPPPFVPSGGLVCNNCGFVRLHALLPLSIDPKEKGGVP